MKQVYYRQKVQSAPGGRCSASFGMASTIRRCLRCLTRLALVAVVFCGVWGTGAAEGQAHSLVPLLSLDLTERYDGNVMLQDQGGQAGQDSFVTSVLPLVGGRMTGEGQAPYSVCLKYAPDFTFFHDLSRETYLRHIGLFDFDVKHKGFSADGVVRAQYTDGTTAPPIWGTTADGDQVPALGATEVRGRRRNMYFASKLCGHQQIGKFEVRGVFDARIWDFMTEDTFVPGLVIQNYYDRSDISGGFDFGIKVHPSVEPSVGYRFGHQDQEYRANLPSYSYANNYHRFLVGLSSKPVDWLALKGEIGPSIHFFDASTVPAGTETQQDYLYFLASATVQLATNTTFEVATGRHVLPASAGNGLFQNLTASGTLDHRFSPKWRGCFRFAFTDYDFNATFTRHDQRFIPEARLEYAFNKHFSAAAWYAYEWTTNLEDVPNGSRREYTRHIAGIGIKATY